MKTLADFKRALVPGAKLRVTFHGGQLVINGNTGTSVISQSEPQERVVSRVQTNSVAFKRPDGKESWLTYPKAADFKVEDGKAVIYEEGRKILTYEFLSQSEPLLKTAYSLLVNCFTYKNQLCGSAVDTNQGSKQAWNELEKEGLVVKATLSGRGIMGHYFSYKITKAGEKKLEELLNNLRSLTSENDQT